MIKNNIKLEILSRDVVFWDFDGVIKKSNEAKLKGFEKLFEFSDNSIREFIVNHHIQNQGISRFDKIPIYLEKAGLSPDNKNIQDFTKRFSEHVLDAVIESEWVEGVLDILESKKDNLFVIVTGTPQEEIIFILKELNISQYFDFVYGSPTKKVSAIEDVKRITRRTDLSDCLFIGDASEDLSSAKEHALSFILVKNQFNEHIDDPYIWTKVNNFKD